jgi:tetratricopeptide (TPR) repeat protein
VLAALRLADVGLDGVGQDKTTSILKCVEYSHSNLSESAQQLLLCLAPFSGFIIRDLIPIYVMELQKLEPFNSYDFTGFDAAIQTAINWGLLSPINARNSRLLSIQPVFPYFLQVRLNESTVKVQEALQDGFKNHYCKLADSYRNLLESNDSSDKKLGILSCKIEYESLYAALQVCIDRHESINIYFCLYKYFAVTNDIKSRMIITEEVYESLKSYPSSNSSQRCDETIIIFDYLANIYGETRKIDKAEIIYKEKINVINNSQHLSEKARKICIANTYRSLAAIALKIHNWNDAYEKLLNALVLYEEFGDRYNQADVYFKLGTILQRSEKWDEAHSNYLLSLEIYAESGNSYDQAAIYHQLGILAEELGELDKAEENYYKSLEIKIKFGDKHSQASTYSQMGNLLQRKSEWSEAKENYYKALEIDIEYGDRFDQSMIYHNLGIVARHLNEREEARNYYNQSLAIKIEFSEHYSQANTYGELGLLAAEEGDPENTVYFLLKALKIFVKFQDQHNTRETTRRLSVMHRFNQSLKLIAEVASILGVSESEVQQIFDSMNQGT